MTTLNIVVNDSSMIKAMEYDPLAEVLTIKFSGGEEYDYYSVPYVEVIAMSASDSLGKYFHKHIRGQYVEEKVSFCDCK